MIASSTDQDGQRIPLNVLEFGFDLLRFLAGLITMAAMPAAIKFSKSISAFGVCTVWGLSGESDLATLFSFGVAMSVNRSAGRAMLSHP